MQTHVTVRLLCAAVLFAVANHLCAQSSQSSLLVKASDDSSHARYSSAKVEIEAAIAIDAKQAEPWYQLGLLDGQMADYRGAEIAFRQAVALDPQSAKAHCRLGQTLVAQPEVREDWKGAVTEFRIALQLDPDYPEAESLLGLGLMHLGDIPASIAMLQHAVQRHPAQASAHLDLALVLEDEPGQEDEAVTEFRAALAAKPDAPETASSLGQLLQRISRLPDADEAFRRALQLNPDLQDAHYGLARVLKSRKQTAAANIEFALAAELEQRKPDGIHAIRLNNEGLQLAAKGDLAGAVACLREAILLKPDYGIAKYNLGLILADSGDFARAKQELIAAASLMPAQAAVWFDLGRVFAKLGQFCGAVESVSWASRLAPANPRFFAELAELRAASPHRELSATSVSGRETIPACGSSSEQPGFGAAADTVSDRMAFAKRLRGAGDLSGATGELVRALALQPNAVDARTELAEIYVSQLRWAQAIGEFRKILLVTGDDDWRVHMALGNALLKAGQSAEAGAEFDEAHRLKPDLKDAVVGIEAARRAVNRP